MAQIIHASRAKGIARSTGTDTLAEVLERVLDRGLVIAGDIRIKLCDVELLTINIRLLVASVDKAKEMGIDWWEHSPFLNQRVRERENEMEYLRRRMEQLEKQSH